MRNQPLLAEGEDVYTYVNVCVMYMCIRICMCVCMYVHMYIRMSVCAYVCLCVHTYVRKVWSIQLPVKNSRCIKGISAHEDELCNPAYC